MLLNILIYSPIVFHPLTGFKETIDVEFINIQQNINTVDSLLFVQMLQICLKMKLLNSFSCWGGCEFD